MVITLDGFSGTGKSTLAKLLAKRLGFGFLNTGMIYRAFTYYFLKNQITCDEVSESIFNKLDVTLAFNNGQQSVLVSDIDVTPYVSSALVSSAVSSYAQILPLREKVMEIQREFAKNNDIVVEGRDIGSVVFPNADVKFFVLCDIKVRAKRRFDDLIKAGQNVTLENVEQSLLDRDRIDTTREISPLVRPIGAVEIDTTNCTIEQSLEQMIEYVKKVKE